MDSSPLVSIGFPVYNGEKFLGRALDSILAQDFNDLEVVIADNASNDNTRLICEDYARRDPRVRYFRNATNIGVNPNHNRVFELSRGKYFAWTAHDVEQLPGMLGRCVREITLAPSNVVLVYPLCALVTHDGLPTGDEQPSIASEDPRPHRRASTVIRQIKYVTQHFGLIAADALRKTRLNGSYASADYVLTVELAMLGMIREIPEALVRRRMDPNTGTTFVLKSQKAWANWLDPKTKNNRFLLSMRERLALEYLRAAWHLPLSLGDKLVCMIVAPAAHYKRTIITTTEPWRLRINRNLHRLKRLLG
jgi:glycosyltransferase involved in cell wall biosynthesis